MNFIEIIISFIITIIAYCGLPIILRLSKGKMEYDKGKKIILINCIVAWVIFTMIKASNGVAQRSGAAFLYYYIDKAILLKEKKKKDDEIEEQNKNIIEPNINNEKYKEKEINVDNSQIAMKTEDVLKDEMTTDNLSEIIENKIVCCNCNTKNKINREYCYMCGSYLNVANRTFKETDETKVSINNGQAISIFNNSMKIAQELELFFQSNKHFKNIIANTEYFAMITLFTCTYFYCGLLKKQKNSSKEINDIAEYVINEINNRLCAPDIENTKKIYNKIINALEDIGNKKLDNNVNPIYGATIYYLQEVTHYNFDNKECTDIEYANILNTVSSKFIEILKS